MRNWGGFSCAAALLVGVLQTLTVEAAEFKRLDGIHRIEKEKAQITGRAVLDKRDGGICGTSRKLCPSSLSGGCCPDNYDCATDSCYATTKGPTVCGTKTGWFVCDPVYGAGCCPQGYVCERGDLCVPPSGSAYTYDCPTGQYLCPASMSYGCCPNGMGCAVNQCYGTMSTTVLNTLIFTTTEDGTMRTYASTSTTVEAPDIPTDIVDSNGVDDQKILKYFPPAIDKFFPTPTSASDGNKGNDGLTTGQLAGIVAGGIAFLIVVVTIAFIIIRHLNKVVAAVSVSKQSTSSKSRPQQQEPKPHVTDSEFDALSVDPFMMSPRPSHPRPDGRDLSPLSMASPDSNDNSFAMGGYQQVSGNERHSRHTSLDAEDYFNTARISQQSGFTLPSTLRDSRDSRGGYTHVRNWSHSSDGSNSNGNPAAWGQPSELEATPYVPELPTSTTPQGTPPTERRPSGGGGTGPPPRHQRKPSGGRSRSGSTSQTPLTVVDEEMHGFHGPSNHFVGQTSHRPITRRSVGSSDDFANEAKKQNKQQNPHSFPGL